MKSKNIVETFNKEIIKIVREGSGYKDLPKIELEEKELLEEFEINHIRYKKVVEEVLKFYPNSTNNDVLLYLEFLRALGLLETTIDKDNIIIKIPKSKFRFFPSPETCTRCRRSLNAKGIGLPTNPYILEKRKRRESVIRNFFKMEKEAEWEGNQK
jgi:hypothetical protein